MGEENSLAFEVRARILPKIEGADQIIQQLQQMPSTISSHVQQTIDSPEFQKGLSSDQTRTLDISRIEGVRRFQEQQERFEAELRSGFESGFISRSKSEKYTKGIEEQIRNLEQAREEVKQRLQSGEFDFLGEEKKQKLSGSLVEGMDISISKTKELQKELGEVIERFNKAVESSRRFGEAIGGINIGEKVKLLAAEFQSTSTTLFKRLQQTIDSPEFQEGLTAGEISKVEHFAGMTDMLEFQKFQEKQKEILKELDIDLQKGSLTKAQRGKYIGKIASQKDTFEDLRDQLISQLNEPHFDFLGQDKKEILRASISSGSQESLSKLPILTDIFEKVNESQDYQTLLKRQERERKRIWEEVNFDIDDGSLTRGKGQRYLKKITAQKSQLISYQQEFEDKFKDDNSMSPLLEDIKDRVSDVDKEFQNLRNTINENVDATRNFYDKMKELSVFAIAGLGVRETINYVRIGKEIEAKEKTSFDLSSPMGMYTEREQFNLFRDTRERERNYRALGSVLGIAGGLALAGLTGGAAAPLVLGGFGAGIFGGSELANMENIEQTGEVTGRLKFMNQVHGLLSGYVNSSAPFDVLRARTRARIGDGAIGGNLEPGAYLPEERLQMRNEFADTLGVWDSELYTEQTAFAGAMRINPADIFKMNLSTRMTGMDIGIGGLKEARETAQKLYGTDVSPQRIIEVLSDIKNLNEEMLKVNVNMDSRDAMIFSKVPEQIFGIDSAYGRMGDLGMETVRQLQDLMKPKSLAHEAFLFQALETPNIMDFTEKMKAGIFTDDNFIKVMQGIQNYTGGNKDLSYFMLNEMMPNAPAGMLPRIAEMLGEGGTEVTRRKIKDIDERTGEIIFEQEKNEGTGKMVDKTETVWITLNDLKQEHEKYKEILKDAGIEEGEKIKKLKEHNELLIGFSDQAKKNFSATEYFNASMKTSANTLGDSFRELTQKMSENWIETHAKIFESTENRIKVEKSFIEAQQEAEKWLRTVIKDYHPKRDIDEKDFQDFLVKEQKERQRFLPKTDENQKLKDDISVQLLKSIEDKFKLEHSESYQDFLKNGVEVKIIVEDRTDSGVNVTANQNANSVFRK